MSQPESPTRLMAALAIQQDKGVADDELEAFRQQWKAEVATRRPAESATTAPPAQHAANDISTSPPTSPKAKSGKVATGGGLSPTTSYKPPLSPTKSSTRETRDGNVRSPPRAQRKPLNASLSTSPEQAPLPFPKRPREQGSAIALYTSAVEAEQAGQLNDALHLYRKAFRADDNVDRSYAAKLRQQAQPATTSTAEVPPEPEVPALTPADIVDPSAPEVAPYSFIRHVQVQPDYEKTRGAVSRLTGLIMARVGVVPEGHEGPYDPAAEFKPGEDAPIPIAQLPQEIIEHILVRLDVAGLEAFGSTCWHARVLTAQSRAWKQLVEKIYKPPMTEVNVGELVDRHRGEWRTTLVEEERLRLDGCYISVCHYVRPGAGEQWVTITHMITYHRFLRFYPDGLVISFLTTDHPSDVVPILRRGLRAKGFHLGRWQLIHDVDDKGKKQARVLITDLMEPGGNGKYEFEMELGLRETNRGRWNKLDLKTYSSIQVASGETLGLSLKHQKPFYFSKVRSYNQSL